MSAKHHWTSLMLGVVACASSSATPDADTTGNVDDTTTADAGPTSVDLSSDTSSEPSSSTVDPTSESSGAPEPSSSSDDTSTTDGGPCSDPDADDDGYDAVACGGDDCNDDDDTIHPAAVDYEVTYELVEDVTSSVVSVDVDDAGTAYVGYLYGSELRIADDSLGGWTYRSNGGGSRFDVHVDGDGQVHTAVLSGVASPNIVAYWPDIDETAEYPDLMALSVPTELRFLAVDEAGGAHLAWHEYNLPEITYAVRSDDGWTTESIEDDVMDGLVVAVAGDGQPWIFYDSLAGPRAATRVDGRWSIESLSGGSVSYAAVAVGVDGSVHLARSSGSDETVRYSTNASGSWTNHDLGDFSRARFTAIAVTEQNTVHIVAEDEPIQWQGSLQLLTDGGGEWQQIQLRADVSAMRPSAKIAGDTLLVAHADLSAYTVQLIRASLADGVDQDCDGSPW